MATLEVCTQDLQSMLASRMAEQSSSAERGLPGARPDLIDGVAHSLWWPERNLADIFVKGAPIV